MTAGRFALASAAVTPIPVKATASDRRHGLFDSKDGSGAAEGNPVASKGIWFLRLDLRRILPRTPIGTARSDRSPRMQSEVLMGSVVAAEPVAGPEVASSRLVGVGIVVFLANAGSLVLQLVAGRLLAPFVGSSLETMSAIIGSFLAGIALGNAVGGRLADRHSGGKRLAVFLVCGGLAALWMLALPELLKQTGGHRLLPLSIRIPILAAILCFPVGFSLSLLTPMAIRLGMPDVRHAGRIAGMVFALGTLGCLAGNYVTGFVLIPNLTVNAIVGTTAGLLFATALGTAWLGNRVDEESTVSEEDSSSTGREFEGPVLPLRRAYLIVFLASFAGMTLELAAARLLAQVLGVSLYTWTGVIGVMLAGTAIGNWLGGVIADRAGKSEYPSNSSQTLASSLALAAACGVYVLIGFIFAKRLDVFDQLPIIGQVLAWTFTLFFPAMMGLGTISPQVIRLAVSDVQHAGRVAGRVYAWSTVGAIAGTFLSGFVLVSELGMFRAVLLASALPGLAAILATRVWERVFLLYCLSLTFGCIVAGMWYFSAGIATRETNYYTILVASPSEKEIEDKIFPKGSLKLSLDHLLHSVANPDDPTFLFYKHEEVQIEFLRVVAKEHPERQNVLVIGGGGYTFPRCARTLVPTSSVDVVEIDPGVTAVSYSHLGLDPKLQIRSFHMDGRQYVSELAPAGHYNLITLDAVNDLSVPAHLLTAEFNEEIKRSLTPDGIYLLTVIDVPDGGRLWTAAFRTLKETFPHVELLMANDTVRPHEQQVMLIYASAKPLQMGTLYDMLKQQGIGKPYTNRFPTKFTEAMMEKRQPKVLTDQFAPVDNLMAPVFRQRKSQ